MNSLRFDLTGACGTAGLAHETLSSLWPRIEQLRTELLSLGNPLEDASVGLPADDRSFFRLPEQQLGDYVRIREPSTLGKIFQVANGLHDQIDAIVVLGDVDLRSGAQALMQACCDPYHNELSRAERGSKPRVYFEPNPYDNDALVALLDRLRRTHCETLPEQRWGVVSLRDRPVLPDHPAAPWSDVALGHVISELTRTLSADTDPADMNELRSRLIVPVGPHHPTLANNKIDVATEFEIPVGLCGSWAVLTPAGLLPAAMLGLDCMKLLEGALAINQHFETTPLEQNFVAQLAAFHYLSAQHLLTQQSDVAGRSLCFWTQALEAMGPWVQGAVQATGMPDTGLAARREPCITTPDITTYVQPRDWERFQTALAKRRELDWVHHWRVTKSRTDALVVSQTAPGESGERSESLDERLASFFQAACGKPSGDQAEHRLGAIETTLSQLDTFAMGQAFQFWLLATWIEKRLWREAS